MKNIEKHMSERMLMIADSIQNCNSIFDTGSDHAFIPIYLIGKNICQMAVASDVRSGPIKVAEKNIRKYGLEDKISLSLCDGITNAERSDCIIIAGMGGQLIADILKREKKIAKNTTQLILQPMNAPEKLRQYLWDNGFSIYFENLCREKHKVYNVICARYTGENHIYNEYELHASEYLVTKEHPLLEWYLKTKLKRLDDMVKGGNNPELKNSKLISELKELVK